MIASAVVGELPDGGRALHRPDLAVLSGDGRVLAVEVELTIKAKARLAAICRGYARARHLTRIYYLAEPAAARAVTRAVEYERAIDRIRVLPLDAAAEILTTENRDLEDASLR